ncbi:MAG TPA: hypothetical protein VFM48_08240 [Aquabacterium sp.]|nr:hypothetical protein [Aquabacterium sp.]
MGGGGGGGDGGATARQQQIEDQKARSRAAVNELFGEGDTDAAKANKTGREALYGQVRQSAFDSGLRDANDQAGTARRNLKFSLFANGLNGGSADIDQNALLQRKYDQGILKLGANADLAANDMRNSDEAARLGLLQSVEAGTDQGSAVSSALNQMRNASDRAAANAVGTTVGDLFGNSGLLYLSNQRAQGAADARTASLFPQGGRRQTVNNGNVTGIYQ